MDDPGLPSDFGHDPARFQGHEARAGRTSTTAQSSAPVRSAASLRRQYATQNQTDSPTSSRAEADHDLKRQVRQLDVRPVRRGTLVEPRHFRPRVVRRQEAQAAGDLDRPARLLALGVGPAADPQRRGPLRPELALHRGELRRLGLEHELRQAVAAQRLQQRADTPPTAMATRIADRV